MSNNSNHGFFSRFRNISIIHQVNFGFIILVLLLLTANGLNLYAGRDITQKLNEVTQQANPLVLQSSALAIELLTANKHFKDSLTATTPQAIENSERAFTKQQASFIEKRHVFERMASAYPELEANARELAALENSYFFPVSEAMAKNAQYRSDRSEILRSASQLQVMIPQLKAAISKKVTELNDDYIRWAADEALNAMSVIEINTMEGLSHENSTQIRQSFERNQKRIKQVRSALSDLEEEIPELRNDMGHQIDQLIRDSSDNDGTLARYLRLIEKREQIDAQTLKLAQHIDELVHALSNINEAANSIATSSANEVQSLLSKTQKQTLGMAIAAIPLALIIAWSIAGAIKRPLNQLLGAMKATAEGDLTRRVDYQGENEFGQLASAANAMIEQMRSLLVEIRTGAELLANISQSNSNTLFASRSELDKQRQETASVAAAMHEMEHSVKEVAASAHLSLEKVLEVEQASNAGREVMNQNISTTHLLSEKLNQSSEVIGEVGQMSDNIDSILDVIRGIADQTNLLALNAAIEAARAGEQGRGFAVVADEVRMLAQKTTHSTSEIQTMIENLQRSAQRAISVVSECTEEMQVSIAQASDANSAMEEIQGIVKQISDMSTQIASAAEQQEATGQEISTNLSRISEISEDNYHSIEEVTNASGEMGNLAKEQDQLAKRFMV